MGDQYYRHIASTSRKTRFLHRCFESDLDVILKEGLACGPDLRTSATWQPEDRVQAENVLMAGSSYGECAVVISFPSEVWAEARIKNRGNEIATSKIGYFHPKRRDFTVRPEFVIGWVDKKTKRYHPNPYKHRKPAAGHEKFGFLFN